MHCILEFLQKNTHTHDRYTKRARKYVDDSQVNGKIQTTQKSRLWEIKIVIIMDENRIID